MKITEGQHKDILNAFPCYDKDKSFIVFEGGNDNGATFLGSFLVKIYRKGVYRFDEGKLTKRVR